MDVALKREIEGWVRETLTNYAKENDIYPVAWTILVESKESFIKRKTRYLLDDHQPLPVFDHMSEICVHIHLRKQGKEADKILFLAPFWEEEQSMMKEVIRLLFVVLESEIVKVREEN